MAEPPAIAAEPPLLEVEGLRTHFDTLAGTVRSQWLPAGAELSNSFSGDPVGVVDDLSSFFVELRPHEGLCGKVESMHLMPRLGQVRSHSAAHIAQTDKSDFHVLLPLPNPLAFLDERSHSFGLVLGSG